MLSKNIFKQSLYFLVIVGVVLQPLAAVAVKSSMIVQRKKVTACFSVFSQKIKHQGQIEWHIYADNHCKDFVKLDKQIKITSAKNVSLNRGTILNTRDFITSPKQKKLIFMAFVIDPKKPSKIRWSLI